MPEFTSYDAGTPSWVDHATKDLEASNASTGPSSAGRPTTRARTWVTTP